MSEPKFEGGSPVTDSSNPFSRGATSSEQTVLGSLPVEARGEMALDNLDGFGSSPVTSDDAAARPSNPPTIGGDAGGAG